MPQVKNVNANFQVPQGRIAFISTRIAGTDGVSLEIEKWAQVIEKLGIECYYITGESDRPDERTFLIEEAHFNHPEIKSISERAFNSERRTPELTDDIMRMTRIIRDKLHAAVEKFDIQGIITENALTIPMNLPLGIALVQSIQEWGMGCVAHHHDFFWERDRFLINAVDDVIRYAFPPALPQIHHVVINSLAAEEFSRRTGLSCRIIPNVMDFDRGPKAPDNYSRSFRKEAGFADDDILILQPTRIVARKGIEHSIELIKRMNNPKAKLVVTHSSGDEGHEYNQYINEYAEIMNVKIVFVDDLIADKRGTDSRGRKLFTLADVYPHMDLVTYPSEYEGFGNAFLEAIFYKKPVICNRYAIYRTDIEPCGFKVVLFDGFLTQDTIDQVYQVLHDSAYRREMVEHNYQVAGRFFGYKVVEQELLTMINRPQNIYRLLHRVKTRE